MDVSERVTEIIGPSVEAMGYDLVRVQMIGATLQIMAERRDGAAMTVDDCAEISRTASALLDVADPIPTAYQLEVSSPGIDRPLTRLADFERFAGFDAKFETKAPIDGRRRFTGTLLGTEDGQVRVDTEGGPVTLPFGDINKAKLVLNDRLIAAASRQN
jgi:ribosome maturation factor RimP